MVSACRGIPFVALNYRSKVMDFCQSISWEEFCLNTDNLKSNQILESIMTLAKARKEYSKCLQLRVYEVRERLLKAVPSTVTALVQDLR